MDHPLFYTYDCENYPNFFSVSIKHLETGRRWMFEISEWKNDGLALYNALMTFSHYGVKFIGFNNEGYDYPLIHLIMGRKGIVDNDILYSLGCNLIKDSFPHMIWPDQRFIQQIDLLKIHHFDNNNKRTSLKMLEFNMRSHNIKDLPYLPGTTLTREQANNILVYNDHDVDETEAFAIHSLPQIDFREKLSLKYDKDFTNHNDTKIGKDYIGMMLNEAGIWTKQGKKVNQTRREQVTINDVILPYVKFERPEFNEALNMFRNTVVTEKDKKGNLEFAGVFKVPAIVDGFQFDFSLGGIHGSLKKTIVSESATHKLIDIDVASYYPNLAIVSDFYPKHLTTLFCQIYLQVYLQRAGYPKNSPENAMLKLALNGVYGDSNNAHSFYYDPKYTMRVTINGQLLLCMLAEQMMKIPGLTMVQINTDGMTYLCPNEYVEHSRDVQKWWEGLTKLELEEVMYEKMFIRDVNNYIAKKKDGKVKRIGCYAHETALQNSATREIGWHKNHSALVVPKAAEAALVRGVNIEQFIKNHPDEFDFMMRTKVPRSSYLELWEDIKVGDTILKTKHKTRLQNIVRYHPSITGGELMKVMPPTAKQQEAWSTGMHYRHENTGKYAVVRPGKKPPSGKFKPVINPNPKRPDNIISIEAKQKVADCSDMKNFNREDIDYEYYIRETRKIVDPLFSNQI